MSCPRSESRGFYSAQVFGPDADGPVCGVVLAREMSGDDEHPIIEADFLPELFPGEHDV